MGKELFFIPRKMFLVSGSAIASNQFTAFKLALRKCGVEQFNLISVSSIFPKDCEIISKEEGLDILKGTEGAVIHCAMSRSDFNILKLNYRLSHFIGTSISYFSVDNFPYGFIAEHHSESQIAIVESELSKESSDISKYLFISKFGSVPKNSLVNSGVITNIAEANLSPDIWTCSLSLALLL